MLLNNQLCDFDAGGSQTANCPEGVKKPRRTALGADKNTIGGKRPRSSMTPVIVLPASNKTVAAFGAPGGTDIIGGVTNVVSDCLLGSMIICSGEEYVWRGL